jgi:hypothetical protein
MTQRHARPGKTHCSLHLLSLQWFVTMNGALGAGRFGSAVGTFLQSLFGISKKVITAFTKFAVKRNMMVRTVYFHHATQSRILTFQSAFKGGHIFSLTGYGKTCFDRRQKPAQNIPVSSLATSDIML